MARRLDWQFFGQEEIRSQLISSEDFKITPSRSRVYYFVRVKFCLSRILFKALHLVTCLDTVGKPLFSLTRYSRLYSGVTATAPAGPPSTLPCFTADETPPPKRTNPRPR